MLTRRNIQVRQVPSPWTNVYGVARSLLALGTAGTLAFTSSGALFGAGPTAGDRLPCTDLAAAGAFCLAPDGRGGLDWMRWACVGVLLLAASGWRPRWTAVPHAYVAFSALSAITVRDGGDQVAAILALLLVVPALGDGRRWHWEPREAPGKNGAPPDSAASGRWAVAGVSALVVARLQMSVIYFQACVAKLPHTEWADGTALYYWANDPAFGAPGWLRPITETVVAHPLGTAALTWTPLCVELGLAMSLLLPRRARWPLLAAGFGFHLAIAVMMGLWSFALAMWGGLVLLCLPLGSEIAPADRPGTGRSARRPLGA